MINNYPIDLIGCCVVEDDGLTEEEYEMDKILKLFIITN